MEHRKMVATVESEKSPANQNAIESTLNYLLGIIWIIKARSNQYLTPKDRSVQRDAMSSCLFRHWKSMSA